MNKIQELKNIIREEYQKEINEKDGFEIALKLINFFELLQTIEIRNKSVKDKFYDQKQY